MPPHTRLRISEVAEASLARLGRAQVKRFLNQMASCGAQRRFDAVDDATIFFDIEARRCEGMR
jgi:hypothetical protein